MSRRDEEFWREQEARHQSLEQPCCTQSSLCAALADMPGDVAVVVHGEGACLDSFFHHLGRNVTSYYGTRLSERQIVAGTTQEPLRCLLSALVRERRPGAVFVLGTCPIELIGDPFELVANEVARWSGVPIRALRTHGLALTSQARCHDWLYEELAALPQLQGSRSGPRRAINIIGLPAAADRTELTALLAPLGLRLNGCYPNGTSLASWQSIAHAETSFAIDRQLYPRLLGHLERSGQRIVEVPLPVGIEPTASFYRTVGRTFDVEAELEPLLAPLLEAARVASAPTAARARGKRLALCVRMLKTHRSDRLAYEGLGELSLLQALGFEVAILVQGPPEEPVRRRFAQRLREAGYGEVPFDVFEGPWRLGEQLREGGFELAVMSDVARNVVEREGVRMLPAGALQPLLAGMAANLRLIDQVLGVTP